MSNATRAPTVYLTAAALSSLPGPYLQKWAYVQDLDRVFQWVADDTSTADNIKVIDASGGNIGTWKAIRCSRRGADLTNADATIYVSGDEWRVLPAATLSANHVLTLGTTQAIEGDRVTITRKDVGAYTYTINNGGVGVGTLATFPVSQRAFLDAEFDGTNWGAVRSAQML